MATTYRKNEQGTYVLEAYKQWWVHWLGLLGCAVFLSLLGRVVSSVAVQIGQLGFWLGVIALPAWRAYRLALRVGKPVRLGRLFRELKLERDIKQTLLETMTVNRQQSMPTVSVPDVRVVDNSPAFFNVTIEKLPGISSSVLADLKEHVTATFRGKLERFGVVSGLVTDNGNSFRFTLEDVGSDKTFRPEQVAVARKYQLVFQTDLVLDISSRPHVALWGMTGSGKTTVLYGLLLQFFSMGADVRFIDGKNEFYAFTNFYDKSKIASSATAVVDLLQSVRAEVAHRQNIVAGSSSCDGKMGRTAKDLDYRPLVLLVDEIGAILASLDTKTRKSVLELLIQIIMLGRSLGVHVVLATQDPSTETLPSQIRAQFSTKILLGSASADAQRMALGAVATEGQVEKFKGFYTCDGKTIQPMRFFVCDLHSHGLNKLPAFEKAYKIGQSVSYDWNSEF